MKNIIFLDLETTGLSETREQILEVAAVAVQIPTFREVAAIDRVVLPPLWPTVRRNMSVTVEAMHTGSGLYRALDQRHEREPSPNAHLVEQELLGFVREFSPHTPGFHTPLCGANPDFDRRFLRKHMPKLHDAFHYRNFDVRSLTQLQDWVFGEAHVDSPHRALADCRQAIQRVRDFLGVS